MDSIMDMLFLDRFFRHGFLESVKPAKSGHIELIIKRSYGEGSCLMKQAGKSLVVSMTNFGFRRPLEIIEKDRHEYFYLGLCRGTINGVSGAHIEKNRILPQCRPAGFYRHGVGISFLPEFFDNFFGSRYGISRNELLQALDALKGFPPIPDAAFILKQIGEASFTGDSGTSWIEAKTLELVSVILDWHRRLTAGAAHALNERDRAGIARAMRYAEEHFSVPLTLKTMANQAAMSISKFTAAFKIHTGLSAAAYIRRIRMEKAMYLLKNTRSPVGDIAEMVGYRHHSRFSTLFREQFDVAPGAFRKKS
jgi:AraC-like DNA-binding protein